MSALARALFHWCEKVEYIQYGSRPIMLDSTFNTEQNSQLRLVSEGFTEVLLVLRSGRLAGNDFEITPTGNLMRRSPALRSWMS